MSVGTPLQADNMLGYEGDQPYLTPDELILMSCLDPNLKLKSDVERDLLNRNNFSMYMSERPDRFSLNQSTTMDNGAMNLNALASVEKDYDVKAVEGKGQIGGFAFLPLIGAIAPMLAPLIGPAINALINLFKKKKTGSGFSAIAPPNAGKGLYPPNFMRGKGVKDYILSRLPEYKEFEKELSNLKGKDAWRNVIAFIHDELLNLLPKVAEVTPQMSEKIVNLIVKRVVPTSFQNAQVASGNPKKGGKLSLPFNAMFASRMVKWILNKVIGNNKVVAQLWERIKKSNLLSESGNVKDNVRNAVLTLIPQHTSITKEQLEPIVNSLLSKFGSESAFNTLVSHQILQRPIRPAPPPEPQGQGPMKKKSFGGSKSTFRIKLL